MRHSLTGILDTKLKRCHGWFFELEILEIFKRAFFNLKSLLELDVAHSGFFKCHKVFSLKMKKTHQKDASHLKNNKNSELYEEIQERHWKKGKNEKRKV